jgi:hypothetical protein
LGSSNPDTLSPTVSAILVTNRTKIKEENDSVNAVRNYDDFIVFNAYTYYNTHDCTYVHTYVLHALGFTLV